MDEIIDAHIHTNFKDELMLFAASQSKVRFSLTGLKEEMDENNVFSAVSIAIKTEKGNLSPKFDVLSSYRCPLTNVVNITAVNPYKASPLDIRKLETVAKEGKIRGLKIYLGYYPFYPYDKVYSPFYSLAEKYKLPVIFHTGNNYSEHAKVKYAHPLNIDEVAVDYKKVHFVIAHLGEPWLIDGAEVVAKNWNVYADLSGLSEGKLENIKDFDLSRLKVALEYCEYKRIMYGSDWPLVPMGQYIKLMQRAIPKQHHKKVFYENAAKVFDINQ
jgi:predicted TIM-barrel fold metal-dependent hydrolase